MSSTRPRTASPAIGNAPSVLCLEGEWGSGLGRNLSIEPVLELLHSLRRLDYIHRDVVTREGLEFHAEKLADDDSMEIKVLYLATHGDEGNIWLGKDWLTLAQLGEALRGRLRGRILYIGSCASLKVTDEELQKLVTITGAKAVIGYRKDVNWLDVAAFEVALLAELVISVQIPALIKRLEKKHPYITKTQGLVVATAKNVHRTPLRRRTVELDG